MRELRARGLSLPDALGLLDAGPPMRFQVFDFYVIILVIILLIQPSGCTGAAECAFRCWFMFSASVHMLPRRGLS